MAFKLVAISALLAVANAGFIGSPISYAAPAAPLAYHAPAPVAYAAPIAKVATPAIAVTKTIDADYDPNPQYSFAYNVQDSLTGDNKEQEETRNGDSVQGRYSLIEADGSRRIVEYTADPINGFNAVVHKEPAQVAVKAVAAAPAVAYAAPVVKTVAAAPALAYASPVVKTVAAAPALAYAAPAAPLAYSAHAAPLAYSAHAAPLAYGAPAQSHLKIIH